MAEVAENDPDNVELNFVGEPRRTGTVHVRNADSTSRHDRKVVPGSGEHRPNPVPASLSRIKAGEQRLPSAQGERVPRGARAEPASEAGARRGRGGATNPLSGSAVYAGRARSRRS